MKIWYIWLKKDSKISWYNLELIDKEKKNEINVLFKCLSLNKKYVHEKENLHTKREKCPLNIQLWPRLQAWQSRWLKTVQLKSLLAKVESYWSEGISWFFCYGLNLYFFLWLCPIGLFKIKNEWLVHYSSSVMVLYCPNRKESMKLILKFTNLRLHMLLLYGYMCG